MNIKAVARMVDHGDIPREKLVGLPRARLFLLWEAHDRKDVKANASIAAILEHARDLGDANRLVHVVDCLLRARFESEEQLRYSHRRQFIAKILSEAWLRPGIA